MDTRYSPILGTPNLPNVASSDIRKRLEACTISRGEGDREGRAHGGVACGIEAVAPEAPTTEARIKRFG